MIEEKKIIISIGISEKADGVENHYILSGARYNIIIMSAWKAFVCARYCVHCQISPTESKMYNIIDK